MTIKVLEGLKLQVVGRTKQPAEEKEAENDIDMKLTCIQSIFCMKNSSLILLYAIGN